MLLQSTCRNVSAAYPGVHALVAVDGQQVLLLCGYCRGREAKRPGGFGVRRRVVGRRGIQAGPLVDVLLLVRLPKVDVVGLRQFRTISDDVQSRKNGARALKGRCAA